MNTLKKILHPKRHHGDKDTHHHDDTYSHSTTDTGYHTTTEPLGHETTSFGSSEVLPVDAEMRAAPASASAEVAPEIIERQENPAIVKQHIQRVEREEVQQVIEREREVAEIQPVIRPINETIQAPTREVLQELPEERREYRGNISEADTLKLRQFEEEVAAQATTTVAPTVHEGTTLNEAIVHEVVRPHIIEQVQPVINTEIIEPTVIRTTKPVYEHIVEAPVVREPRIEAPIMRSGTGLTSASYGSGVMPETMGPGVAASAASLPGSKYESNEFGRDSGLGGVSGTSLDSGLGARDSVQSEHHHGLGHHGHGHHDRL